MRNYGLPSATTGPCRVSSLGLDVLSTSSASVLVSLRTTNGSRQCGLLLSEPRPFELLMHRKTQGRWQALVSGLLPRELPGVRCRDEHGCIFRACLRDDGSGGADQQCTQPSALVRTPAPLLPSPEPHLAARLELLVSPPLSPPIGAVARAWARELTAGLAFRDFLL